MKKEGIGETGQEEEDGMSMLFGKEVVEKVKQGLQRDIIANILGNMRDLRQRLAGRRPKQ